MDTLTLRIAFGVVALCVLVLFFVATYRPTRSAYSGWWCVSLAVFLTSAVLFLLNGTPVQVVANPLGNACAVFGATGVWAAARSLRSLEVPRRAMVAAPAVVLVASLLDDPANDVWTGGPFFLSGMALGFALAARELWLVRRGATPEGASGSQRSVAVASLFAISSVTAAFYVLRGAMLVAVGPEHPAFAYAFGSQVTTLLTMMMLVVVTFSMALLGHEQQTSELRVRATHDGLTGLLNRATFLEHAELAFRARPDGGTEGAVMVADLDGFKSLNDDFGHAVGDHALTIFGTACREVVGDHGVVGRLGGDEFALLLADGSRAELVAGAISRRFRAGIDDGPRTTISFGIAQIDRGIGVRDTIIRADVALYQAKAAGRDRAVRYEPTRVEAIRV
ncbi:diguanylate cyclase (GGDEF)-like protein [Nocardioides thalensis]|uniref:Diguanylate cyclase (GGDEF)-like protein n=1 Tax=Nocardioides thalensis TaxID=1914755 RepID=A0A853BZM9_9ACTN|nr:GGDEF domain-containing protein [Nocardioides thalensis]NYJ00609.1 diguanylate cyclase (GGDEF)-like protein [Nocardioides thalensis]